MKKLSILALAVLSLLTSANAQSRKTWDFSGGVSDETKLDLNADATNWAVNRKDSLGVAYGWKNNAKLTNPFSANGNVIKEFEGLTFGGTLTAGVILIDATTFRLGKADNTITFPKLAPGQTITIECKSANASTARGVKANANLEKLAGPDGDGATGSEGIQTYVFQVPEGNDSVVPVIGLTQGGVDIRLIMIDKGDEAVLLEDPNVAYVYYGDLDEDKFRTYSGLDDYASVTDILLTDLMSTVPTDSLEKFDVVILSQLAQQTIDGLSERGIHYPADTMLYLLNRVPMLSTYPAAYMGYTLTEPATGTYTVPEDYLEESLFADISFGGEADNELEFIGEESGVYGYTLAEGSDFASDVVYATAGDANAIHMHGKRNSYMLIPFNSDMAGSFIDNAIALISNAVKYLQATKADVLTASKPSVTYTYGDQQTTATLRSALAGAKIYYTLDDTDPTTASALYTEPLVFSADGTILKAMVVAQGYNNSAVLRDSVIIKKQLQAPVIAVSCGEGSSAITLSSNVEGANVYFTFDGYADASLSAAYSGEPIVITEPATITAIAMADGYMDSELAQLFVPVYGIPAVQDTLTHFAASKADWVDNIILTSGDSVYNSWDEAVAAGVSLLKSKAYYHFGTSTWSEYTKEVEDSVKLVAADGSDSIVYTYKKNEAWHKSFKSTTNRPWIVKTDGQVATIETDAPQRGIGIDDGVGSERKGRYAAQPQDLIGMPVAKGMLDFGSGAGSMRLETDSLIAGPFDVVVYLGNGSTDSPVLTIDLSADGQEWATLDTVNVTNTQRYWRKTRAHYAETTPVYVRIASHKGSKSQLYDVYIISTDGVTGIEAISAQPVAADAPLYDLQGRRAETMVRGQLYIRNGKKVFVK